MDSIKLAINNLQDSIPAEKREKDVDDALMQLQSMANFLVGCI
jgi:hypothetical protein